MKPIEQISHKGYTINIFHDDCPTNPRKWDNLGTMVCFHDRYNLGDKHDLDIEEVKEIIQKKDVISLPLYLYDHSGITIRTVPFSCSWDSGQVGFIYVTFETIRKEYGWKRITNNRREKIEGYLKNEVSVYDDYLTGSVYGYQIETPEGEEVEDGSCWGFFGYDHEKSGLKSEAISCIEWDLEEKRKAKLKRTKAMIKNKVPVQYR